MKRLYDSNIDRIVKKIKQSIKKKQKESKLEVDPGNYSYLSEMINRHTSGFEFDSVRMVCQALIAELPTHPTRSIEVQETIVSNIANEAFLSDLESHHYYKISQYLVQTWYNVSVTQGLQIYPAMILLAIYLGLQSHKGLKINQIVTITGFDFRTVRRYMNELELLGLIASTRKGWETKNYLPANKDAININPASFINNLPEKCWLSELDPFSGIDEVLFSGYLPNRPRTLRNPHVYKAGNEFVFHKRFLNAATFAAAVLTRDQINTWLTAAHGNNIRPRVQTLKKQVMHFVEKELAGARIDDPHYEQIRQFFPISQYVGKRTFDLDTDELLFLQERNQWRLNNTIQDFKILIKKEELLRKGPAPWDVNFFIECLQKMEVWHSWIKRYPDMYPMLPNLEAGGDPEFIKLDDVALGKAGIKMLPGIVQGGEEIFRIYQTASGLTALGSMVKNQEYHMTSSVQSTSSILDKATHRNHLVKVSPQNIPKSIRPIFTARENHQFLIVDINSFDLEIWKVLAAFNMGDEKTLVSEDFTFDQLALSLNLSRSQVKTSIYAFMYGAGTRRILAETGLAIQEWNVLKKRITQESFLMAFRQKIKKDAEENELSPPTPLGFQTFLSKREAYKALSYVVQATGAEIFRAWVLQLKERGLGQYIVNMIHDEIIFEVPDHLNVYNVFSDVQYCLRKASKELLPSLQLTIKGSACRRWDEKAAIKIANSKEI
jgi:hypothetical protein